MATTRGLLRLTATLVVVVVATLALTVFRPVTKQILQAVGVLPAREQMPGYRAALARFAEENTQLRPGCTLLIGDSLTEAFPPTLLSERGWTNRGISGDRIKHMRQRLHVSVLETPCETVAVLAGTNDIVGDRRASADVAADLRTLVLRLEEAGRNVVLQTLPPTRGRLARTNRALREVNAAIVEAPATVTFDLHTVLVDRSGELRGSYSRDGLHLTRAGYAVWASGLERALLDLQDTK